MQFPITIGLRRSRFGRPFLCLLACLMLPLWVIWGWQGAPWWQLAFSVSILGLLLAVDQMLLRATVAVAALRLEADGRLLVRPREGVADVWLPLTLSPVTRVHPWLTVISGTLADGRGFSLCLTVDRLNREDFRRLRVFLAWRLDQLQVTA